MPQTISLTPDNSTAVKFRAWGSAVSAAIAANGQVQTADTGQINWTTVALPSGNVSGGYEIWRFADTLQATAPVYFKLEYGFNSSAAPQIWLTVGTGSDGAGTITGSVSGVLTPQIVPRTALSANGGPVVVAQSSYVNGNSGCLAMFLFPNNNPAAGGWTGFVLVIERTKDAAGADTGDGLMIATASSASSNLTGSCFLTYLPGVRVPQLSLSYYTSWPIMSNGVTANVQTMTVNGVVYPAQVFTGTGPKSGGPSQYLLGVTIGDLAAAQVVAISHYGTSRNWYSAGAGYTSNSLGWGNVGGSADMAMVKSFLFRIN